MRRRHLIELEDLHWWPRIFRDAVTDYLVTAQRTTRMYAGFVSRLAAALRRCGATRIVDLCSGAGGPWIDLLPALHAEGIEVSLCLTDKYPNTDAFAALARELPGMTFETAGISAADVPSRLSGFRTMFTSFHHFKPQQAREILAAAVRDGQGIAIFEWTARTPQAFGMMLLVPLTVWLLTPKVRPFRWSRLLWTYLVPVIPGSVLLDGLVSCFRTYTAEEMLALARQVGDSYDWQAGNERPAGCPFAVPYLIGVPREPDSQKHRSETAFG